MRSSTRGSPTILLCVVDRLTGGFIEKLSAAISGAFAAKVRSALMLIDLGPAHDRERNQLEAAKVLKILGAAIPPAESKVLAITDRDLYSPVMSHVFGEAERGGRISVMSLFRLRASLYGLPESPETLLRRAARKSIHLLGHTFGLIHCPYPMCPMSSSTSPEDLDAKSADLCPGCRHSFAARWGRSTILAR